MSGTENVDVGKTQETESPLRDQHFNKFFEAGDLVEIVESFQALCSEVGLDSTQYEGFYSTLKKQLTFWKACALWQLLDARASLPEYEGQKACEGKRVLVIGAGPVGLRSAIEAALLGAKVDVVEKRNGFSRNNSLHLWPFLITDLRNLGAKKFYGKFASGTIDHICIRILQGILLKICLLLGVKVHGGVTFTGLVEPKNANGGWTATVNPSSCPVSSYHFDVIMAVDGKQNSLPGFRLKEFRAKLALAITVNFVNSNTKQESSVPEISGVAYVYRQDFFKSLASIHGIELENIVYYKDETHYFVMTATKNSLLKKGVLKKDNSDPEQLLAKANIDQKSLERYAVEAATYSTEGALGDVKFEKNHRGENDVALFDFTSLFAAENAARILERKGKRILLCVAGDTLIEPFWPTGSGCARGFLGAFDNAWMMKRFVAGVDPIDLLEEREAILYLLPQTTPERLVKNFAGYTIDPKSRYLFLNELVPPGDVTHLFSTDNLNAMNAAKNRSQALPVTSVSTKTSSSQESRQRTIPSVEDTKPKRSKSSEGLASKAESAESPYESPPEKTRKPNSSPPQSQNVKEFWQKRQSLKSSSKSESKSSASQSSTASKPPLPSSAKSQQKVPTQSGSPGPAKTSPRASPQPSSKTKDQATASPKFWKKGSFSPAKSASPEPVKKSGKKVDNKAKQSPKSSPKWSRFSNKGRSKSESPERELKKDKASTGHPLEVATSLRSLDRETEEAEQQQNVLDIIKQYNKKDEDVQGQQKQGKTEVAEVESKSSKGSAKKISSKGSKAEKVKQKQHKEKSTKDEKKEASSHKGWNPFSFFKKKSYNVSEEETTLSVKQPKKSKKQVEDKIPAEEPLTVQGRIKQLMEHGVATDGTEDPDSSEVVLVSVSREAPGEHDGLILDQTEVESQQPDQPPAEDEIESDDVKSKLEGLPHVPEDEEVESVITDDNIERVKKLQSLFQKMTAESSSTAFSRSFSVSDGKQRSKEIDLSEVLSRESEEKTSHPLWLARVIQALNKCLERLRKENDIIVAKTALEIMNTIFNNVQSYPNDDTYRRVRISSEQFHDKIWQFNNARQFLARSGWVAIDDFIVLPVDSKLDTPKRVLDKHLEIVNQMLWSMHLELPHSPTVVKRPAKFRDRSLSLMRRESYATRIVEESLLRVEEDKMAMAAAKMRKSRGSFGARVTSPSTLETLAEGSDEISEEPDHDIFVHMSTQEDRIEEVQTMKAASAARDIWKQKESIHEREYRFNLETELYDLPRRKISVHKESSVSPTVEGTSTNTPPSEGQETENTTIPPSEQQEPDLESTEHSNGTKFISGRDQLKTLTQNVIPASAEPSSVTPIVEEQKEEVGEDLTDKNVDSILEQTHDTTTRTTPSPTSPRNVPSTPTKKLSDSSSSDQLRKLMMRSPIPPKNGASTDSGLESQPTDSTDGPSALQSDESIKTADAQYSTTTSIKSGRQEYERLTMEAAAQTRQKWKDTEAAINGSNQGGTSNQTKTESSSVLLTKDKPEEEDKQDDASEVVTTL